MANNIIQLKPDFVNVRRFGGSVCSLGRSGKAIISRMKAAKAVFSLAEVLLLIERGKKNAALAAFN